MYFYVQVIKSKTYKKKCQLDELKAKKSNLNVEQQRQLILRLYMAQLAIYDALKIAKKMHLIYCLSH